MVRRSVNKSKLARELGVSRGSLYYIPKREVIDEELKKQIESVMADHLDYGHKRVALHLKMGHNRIRRVMKKYGMKPYRRKSKKPVKKQDRGKPATHFENLIVPLLTKKLILKCGQVWCTDYTYIPILCLFAINRSSKTA